MSASTAPAPAKPAHPVLQWLGALSSALPCFYLSWVLVNVWQDPMAWDQGAWIRLGIGLLLLEFILLHSGAFMGSLIAGKGDWLPRLKLMAGLTLFYALMVWAFATALDSETLIWIFASVCLGRLITALTNAEAGSRVMMSRSAMGIVLYMLMAFLTIFLPIPEWGITDSIVAEVYPDRGGGIWERDPERAIAGAAFYFALLGLAELFILKPTHQSAHSKAETVLVQSTGNTEDQ